MRTERTKGITVSLRAGDVEALRAMARREDRSVSSIIRRAIRELAKHEDTLRAPHAENLDRL